MVHPKEKSVKKYTISQRRKKHFAFLFCMTHTETVLVSYEGAVKVEGGDQQQGTRKRVLCGARFAAIGHVGACG